MVGVLIVNSISAPSKARPLEVRTHYRRVGQIGPVKRGVVQIGAYSTSESSSRAGTALRR